jgi:hypothetical protein
MFQRITTNLVGAQKRYEMLDGEQHLVVPAVMLTEGVWRGTQGPLLYQNDELARNPSTWNHKPVVIDHPVLNGDGISACDPAVVEKQRVGMLFNTTHDGKLRTEAWLREDKLKRVSPKILESLNSNMMVEISTGLFHDLEETPGNWNGKEYTGVVRNIQPDHLAILTGGKGAFSISDGGGLLRNSDGISYDDIRSQLSSLLRTKRDESLGMDYCYVCDIYPKFAVVESGEKTYKVAYKIRNGKVSVDGEPEEVRRVTSYVTANGLTLMDDSSGPINLRPPGDDQLSPVLRYQQMQKSLEERFKDSNSGPWAGWVTEVNDSFVTWIKDGLVFRLPYSYKDDKIMFNGDPEQMTKPPTTNSRGTSTMTTPNTNAAVAVADLGKGDGQTHGAGREGMVNAMNAPDVMKKFLMDLPDDGFEKVAAWVKKGAAQEIVPYTYDGIKDRSNVNNQLTEEQYVNMAPPGIREVLANALVTHSEIKKRLIKTITSNQANRFNEKWLEIQPIEHLKGIAALAGGRAPVARSGGYAGQGDTPPMFIDNNAADAAGITDDEILQIPTINWSDEKKSG